MRFAAFSLVLSALGGVASGQTQISCSGICFISGSILQNPVGLVTVGGVQDFCTVFDNRFKASTNDAAGCRAQAEEAQAAGCVCSVVPTPAPTNSPTPLPTASPTTSYSPTISHAPTDAPSTSPPTESPTQSPTLGLVITGDDCPGICFLENSELLNQLNVVTLPNGFVNFCGVLDNEVKAIKGDPQLCQSNAVQAQKAGCECSEPPTSKPSMAPTSKTAPPTKSPAPTKSPTGSPAPTSTISPTKAPITPTARPTLAFAGASCPGVCLQEGATMSEETRTKLVTLPGGSINFCGALDIDYKSLAVPEPCVTQARAAQEAGCICIPPPTESPTPAPTRFTEPPTRTPTGSPAPTKTASPTKVPTTASPTIFRGPAYCPGVCYKADYLLNPDKFAVFKDQNGVITGAEKCSALDTQYKSIFNSAAACDSLILSANRAGCRCGARAECDKICPLEGDEVLNPTRDIFLPDGYQGTCGSLDTEIQETIDEADCAQPDRIAAALVAGCKCGAPVDCDGMCTNGDEMLTPDRTVTLSDGTTGTCAELDQAFDQTIDPERCSEIPGLVVEAKNAGCNCGTPIECPGICTNPTDVITNSASTVTLPDGRSMTCFQLDLEIKKLIDGDTCVAKLDEALVAGCRCGVPYDCLGICPPNNNKLFDKKVIATLPDGTSAKCGDIDKDIAATIIDEILCLEKGREAIQAGCQCGDTTPSPTNFPTISFEPTRMPTTRAPIQGPTEPGATSAPVNPTFPAITPRPVASDAPVEFPTEPNPDSAASSVVGSSMVYVLWAVGAAVAVAM